MSSGYRAAIALLSVYAIVFAALALDLLVRIVDWRDRFETPLDVAVLIYFEGIHMVVTIAGVALALFAARRAREFAALAPLAVALLLATVAYSKIIAFKGFGGAVQESVAIGLLERGTPRWLLMVLFGHPEWAAWPAVAGLLLFAARYPRPLTPYDVAGSGARDRAGALRGVPLAGSDIGSAARRLAVALLRRGWLSRDRAVWLFGSIAGILHTVLLRTTDGAGRIALHAAALLLAGAAAAVLIALVRAGRAATDPAERPLLDWLRRGALLTLILLAISAATALLFPGGILSLIALSLAPMMFVVCAAAGTASVRRRLAARQPTSAQAASR